MKGKKFLTVLCFVLIHPFFSQAQIRKVEGDQSVTYTTDPNYKPDPIRKYRMKVGEKLVMTIPILHSEFKDKAQWSSSTGAYDGTAYKFEMRQAGKVTYGGIHGPNRMAQSELKLENMEGIIEHMDSFIRLTLSTVYKEIFLVPIEENAKPIRFQTNEMTIRLKAERLNGLSCGFVFDGQKNTFIRALPEEASTDDLWAETHDPAAIGLFSLFEITVGNKQYNYPAGKYVLVAADSLKEN